MINPSSLLGRTFHRVHGVVVCHGVVVVVDVVVVVVDGGGGCGPVPFSGLLLHHTLWSLIGGVLQPLSIIYIYIYIYIYKIYI